MATDTTKLLNQIVMAERRSMLLTVKRGAEILNCKSEFMEYLDKLIELYEPGKEDK